MKNIVDIIDDIHNYKVKDIEECFNAINIEKDIDLNHYLNSSSSEKQLFEILLNKCLNDERLGIQKAAKSFNSKINKYLAEKERTMSLYKYEMDLWLNGCATIVGIDEVGRGCVAGPVVAGAVILPMNPQILYLNDSKKLSTSKREQLNDEILKNAIDYALGEVSANVIDDIGIVAATFLAMKQAISQLTIKPNHILVDAFKIPGIQIKQTNIINGDALSASIAAASIVAKVYRDRKMDELHNTYNSYNFKSNKGYGTLDHMSNIRENGLTDIHRKSFLKEIYINA